MAKAERLQRAEKAERKQGSEVDVLSKGPIFWRAGQRVDTPRPKIKVAIEPVSFCS